MAAERGRLDRLYAAAVALILVDTLLGLYAALRAPFPAKAPIGTPTAYLNIYIHIPMAWASYLLFTGAFVSALLYLRSGSEKWDRYTQAFTALGLVYGGFTLVSGMAWASESWGAAWTWDPRETGVLLLLLAYSVYFVLRGSIADPDRASYLSASYAVAAYVMVPVSFVAPRVASRFGAKVFHPTSEEFGKFMASPEVMKIFGPKVLLATVTALLLAYLAAKALEGYPPPRWLPAAAALVAVVGVAAGLYVALPYLEGGVARVAGAELQDGKIVALNLSTGNGVKTVVFEEPVESPVKLVNGSVVDSRGVPLIVKHLVRVVDGRIVVVRHWSVALNLAAYAVASAAALMLTRLLYRKTAGPS